MRMLSKIVVSGALSAIVAAMAPAHAEEGKKRFSHEGYTYVYEVRDTKTGKLISGRRYPDAVAFNLSVKNGKVSGVSGGQPVSFDVEDARGASQR